MDTFHRSLKESVISPLRDGALQEDPGTTKSLQQKQARKLQDAQAEKLTSLPAEKLKS